MLMLTIVQNFVKLPHLEVTFLETRYLSVFGLCKPIIYITDELSKILLQTLYLPMILTSSRNAMAIHPVVQGAVSPPIYM